MSIPSLRNKPKAHFNTKHGFNKSRTTGPHPLYRCWQGIKRRCLNPNEESYPRYGGRGIAICSEWQSFVPFKDWALANGYQEGLTIDRIDNEGHYQSDNCRWVSMVEQNNNRSDNRVIEFNGKTQTLAQWAKEVGLKRATLHLRLATGWSVKDAFTTPKVQAGYNRQGRGTYGGNKFSFSFTKDDLRRSLEEGISRKEIAERFGCSTTAVSYWALAFGLAKPKGPRGSYRR